MTAETPTPPCNCAADKLPGTLGHLPSCPARPLATKNVGKRLHRYEFEGYVQGPFDGEVWAQNKQEAIERAQADMEAEGLTVVGKIKVRKV